MKRLFLLVALIPTSELKWNLNDVSILMALPTKRNTQNHLLSAKDTGKLGILLPRELFEKVGPLSNATIETTDIYDKLRAVAFRLDPCPSGGLDGQSKCLPELRIVWQPVIWNSQNQNWTCEDTALHTFYRLNSKQMNDFKSDLFSLKKLMSSMGVSTVRAPLNIHPALLSPKTSKLFQDAFQALVVKAVGNKNLYRITAMKLFVQNNWWKFFTGFEKIDGQWNLASIPRLDGIEVDIINDATEINPSTGQTDEVDASIFALYNYPTEDDLRPIVSSSFRSTFASSNPDPKDIQQFTVGLGASHRLQNPHRTNPNTVDCAHCHYSNAAQVFALKTFPHLKTVFLNHHDRYVNPDPDLFDLSNKTVVTLSTKVLRAFGYFENEPAIMNRTINDSAMSAHWLNQNP